jgi:hypothetical protein
MQAENRWQAVFRPAVPVELITTATELQQGAEAAPLCLSGKLPLRCKRFAACFEFASDGARLGFRLVNKLETAGNFRTTHLQVHLIQW